ncbi:hypothetical protein DHW03_16660 [Pedobacter yonginense]|uniref:Glycosyltransferase 2-like domain-containing protein n=1 Tax=Pedobacter yonginense TaxID=651869 RepID=A0A317EIF5_9SPHI|nr:glycosyltransferase family 2 protein [Pedobacter yonginense]PWS26412.1 hypothetical protein DHW03_16660 [Pedobacter yonginense]
MNTAISFFIPAYNCAQTIEEAVRSILDTNFKNGDELIIVNDGSTNDTQTVLIGLQSTYPTIQVIEHGRNKGGGAARNTAIEASKNELLFCLDADNVLEENSIAPLLSHFQETEADVASFQHHYYFSKTKTETDTIWTLPSGVFEKEMALSTSFTPGSGGNYLFTKNSWVKAGGYPEFAGALDTWGFGLRQLLTGAKVVVLANSYYYHRLINDSYYLRDAWSRRKSISLRATQLLIPFFDEIEDRDIDYILSNKHRCTWFDDLDSRPIRLVSKTKQDGIFNSSKQNQTPFKSHLKNLIQKFIK